MSSDEDARAEAERRWPIYPAVGFSGAADRQHAFVEGAEWQRSRPVSEPSEEAVEAGARVLDEAAMDSPADYPLAYTEAMQIARDILIAAAEASNG